MRKLFTLLMTVILLGVCGQAFADRDEHYVRAEAEKRNIKLLSVEEAKKLQQVVSIQVTSDSKI